MLNLFQTTVRAIICVAIQYINRFHHPPSPTPRYVRIWRENAQTKNARLILNYERSINFTLRTFDKFQTKNAQVISTKSVRIFA